MDYSNLFVVLMGLGTVFAGLLCIILLVTLMSWVCNGCRTFCRNALHDGRHRCLYR